MFFEEDESEKNGFYYSEEAADTLLKTYSYLKEEKDRKFLFAELEEQKELIDIVKLGNHDRYHVLFVSASLDHIHIKEFMRLNNIEFKQEDY